MNYAFTLRQAQGERRLFRHPLMLGGLAKKAERVVRGELVEPWTAFSPFDKLRVNGVVLDSFGLEARL